MRRFIQLNVDDVVPTVAEVLENQGMAGRARIPERISALLDSALELFRQLAEPQGVLEDLRKSDFAAVYNGDGLNSPQGPVLGIVSQADSLALFAATLGNALIVKSSELFAQGGPALGFMLDAVNSSGAERLGKLMGHQFVEPWPEERSTKDYRVQYYSPGHCGWHISGQTKLFQVLHPEEIGITLNASWAMRPIKSISGILVAGDLKIHRFRPDFSFCKECKAHTCVQRLKVLESDYIY
jgi:hypothetical protein